MKHTFIYTDDKSNKFWTIEINGNTFTVNYGKVGTDGQTQEKEFDNDEACQKAAEKLIAEKTKKGYVETADIPNIVPKTEKKATKKYVTFVEEVYSADDTDKKWGFEAFNVDINDPESIIATLKSFSKKISDEETREEWEGNGSSPHFGKIENEIFYPLESNKEEEDDEDNIYSESYFSSATFYRIAAECEQSRSELAKLCKQIIKINLENSGCPTWESEEHLLGASQAFALAMADKKYINLAGEMMASMYNGDHTTPDTLVDSLLYKWGANDDTLEFAVLFITEMPLQDLYYAESIFISYFKDYLKDEKNINKFLEVYAGHVVDSHSEVKDLFEKIFPDLDCEKLAEKFTKLVEQKQIPTFKMLTTEQEEQEEVTASYDLFIEKMNKTLTELNIDNIPEGKEYSYSDIDGQYMRNGQHQIKASKEYGYYEFGIAGVKTITDKDFKNKSNKGNPEIITIANKLNTILPDFKALVGGIPCIRLNTNVRYKIYDTITTDIIKKQLFTLVGCEDLMTYYLTEVNYNRLTLDDVMKKLDELQSSIAAQPGDVSEFENKVLQYLNDIKEITIIKHDKNSHTISVHYNNPKVGDSVGVITIYPIIKKISITVPYYQGELKQNESEIDEWCERRESMCVNGRLAFDSDNGYVWFRNIVDIETITNNKIFIDAITEYLKEDAPYFAPLIKKVAEGESANDVIAYENKKYNEKIARKTKVNIELPDDIRKIGIYADKGERLLHAFMEYGKDFYDGNTPKYDDKQATNTEEKLEENKIETTVNFTKPNNSKCEDITNQITVDLNSVADMKHVLEMLIANINEYSEMASPNDGIEFGHVVDGNFEMFDEDVELSEAVFFENAAKHPELHHLIAIYVDAVDYDQFIEGCSDMRMGMNAIFSLAAHDDKYIPRFIEHHRKIRPGGGHPQLCHIIDLLSDTDNGLRLLAACCAYVIDNENIEHNIEGWISEYVSDDVKKQKKLFDYMMQEVVKILDNEFLVNYITEALEAMGVEYDDQALEDAVDELENGKIPKFSDIVIVEEDGEDEENEEDNEPVKRTFIYSDDKSNKFWSIEVDDCELTVKYGKVGTEGQTQTKEFDDEEECQKAAKKLIAEKTKKGYVEQTKGMELPKPAEKTAKSEFKIPKYKEYDGADLEANQFVVNIKKPESIASALKWQIDNVDEFLERFNELVHDGCEGVMFGIIEDEEFVPLCQTGKFDSVYDEEIIAEAIVKYPQLYPITAEYIEKVVLRASKEEITSGPWATEETILGQFIIPALVECDKKYTPLLQEFIDTNVEIRCSSHFQNMFKKE